MRQFIFFILLIFYSCSKTGNEDNSCQNASKITQISFCTEHTQNVIVAKDYYLNKSLQIAGEIWQIEEKNDTVNVKLKYINNSSHGTCYYLFHLRNDQREEIKKYVVGDSISFCGNYYRLNDATGLSYAFYFKDVVIE